MRVCKIIDEYRNNQVIGYLFYYEKEKVYSIELDDKVSKEEMPLFFFSFVKRGNYTLSPEWSRRWVMTRVVPEDRQNLGMILRDSGLKTYDMFRLLMIAEGRCAQDDCAVLPARYEDLPAWVFDRRRKKIELAVRLDAQEMIIVYRDGTVYRTCIESRPDMRMLSGGVGIITDGVKTVTAEELYGKGIKLEITSEELRKVAVSYIMDTREVCDKLNCSRQYVNQLTKSNGVSALRDGGVHLYARSDIEKLTE